MKNDEMGVTPEQVVVMEAGSMFRWSADGEETGTLIHQ